MSLSPFRDTLILVLISWSPFRDTLTLLFLYWSRLRDTPLCCFPIGFRNSQEFRAELDDRMGSQTNINSITSYNSGIPRNSYRFLLIIHFRNSVRNWMVQCVVKQVSILLHLLILEFPGIPSYYPMPEFRAESDDRMGSQTSINSITSYNFGIPRNS